MAKPFEFSGSASTTEASTDVNFSSLEALVNDGSSDIIFGFDSDTLGRQVRTVKAGEQYSAVDLGINCRTLYYRAASGSQPFRAWGIK